MGGSEVLKIQEDLYVTVMATYKEIEILRGETWRFSSAYRTVTATNGYLTMSFTTPATGQVTYNFAAISKTGNEAIVNLIEAGTYVDTGSTLLTGYNFNRNIATSCPIIDMKVGLLTGGTTIASGTSLSEDMVPGTSQGNLRAGGTASSGSLVFLKPATRYTLKILSVSGAMTVTANIDLIWEDD